MVALKLVIKVVSKEPTLKPGPRTSTTIGDCKTKNVIEFNNVKRAVSEV